MIVMKALLASLFLFAVMPAASAASCPDDAVLKRLTDMGNLYIGEMHGTQESPAFLHCLVAYEVAHGVKNLAVSVEFEDRARDLKDVAWAANDGRTSQAMASTLQWLMAEESKGHLVLHFQRGDTTSLDGFDRRAGEGIRALADKHRVIAYSGNFHVFRKLPPEWHLDVRPAGSYVGSSFTTIDLANVGAGTAWNSINGGTPGVHAMAPMERARGQAGTLVDAKADGYDFIYLLPTFTASLPHMPYPASKAP
jgi:hypothetical protein